MKKLCMICAAIIFIGCFDLPIWYYTILRTVVTIGALGILSQEVKKDVTLLGITFIIIAILFNPILPIYGYQKTIWITIDITTGLLFLVYGFKDKNIKN